MLRAAIVALALVSLGGCKELAPKPRWHTKVATACAEAATSGKPVFFFLRADWDIVTAHLESGAFEDLDVRSILARNYVALHVDRSNTYMSTSPPADEEREVEVATSMFHPYMSKGGTIVVMASDCKTERYRSGGAIDGPKLAADLRAAMDGPVPTRP